MVTQSHYPWNRVKDQKPVNPVAKIQQSHGHAICETEQKVKANETSCNISRPFTLSLIRWTEQKRQPANPSAVQKNPKWIISLVYHETKQVWSYVEGPWAGQPLNTWDERQNPKWQMRYDQGIVYAREYMNSGLGRHTVIWWWKRIASPFPCRKPWLCKESGVLELQELAAEQFGD